MCVCVCVCVCVYEVFCISRSANTLGKCMNSIIPPPATENK